MFSISRIARPATSIIRPQAATQQSLRPLRSSFRSFHATTAKMGVHNIKSHAEFKTAIASHPIVILDAFATWCGPCKAIAPQIVKWSEEDQFKDKIYFAKFDVDELPDLAQELGVRAMPTFVLFKDGNKADEFVGANPQALLKLLQSHVEA